MRGRLVDLLLLVAFGHSLPIGGHIHCHATITLVVELVYIFLQAHNTVRVATLKPAIYIVPLQADKSKAVTNGHCFWHCTCDVRTGLLLTLCMVLNVHANVKKP